MRAWIGWTAILLLAGCGDDDDGGTQCNCAATVPLCRCPHMDIDAGKDGSTGPLDASSRPDGSCVALESCAVGSWDPTTCTCANVELPPCSSVGSYERGKGDSTPDCCPSLNMVSRLETAEINGAAGCTQLPLATFMCIRGTCGDGVCEAPEAEPCGCLADCPSAAYGNWDGGTGF